MSNKIKQIDFGSCKGISFRCPGCGEMHQIPVQINQLGAAPSSFIWGWNGSLDKPTITPSILMQTGHHAQSGEVCWCTYNAEHPNDPAPFKCTICHSFVRDGRIEFLSDCTHELAGQTVPLPEVEAI